MIWVSLGGSIGAILRFLVGQFFTKRLGSKLPIGTLVVNCSGCFMMGVIGAMFYNSYPFFTTGIIGGYTTISTFIVEGISLWKANERKMAVLYGIVSIIGGSALLLIGMIVGDLLFKQK